MKHVYPKLRKSAQGQDCTLQISGVCCGDPAKTILAHLPSEFGGMGKKSPDFCACFACFDCHEVLDGRVKYAWGDVGSKEGYMRKAQIRTMRIWFEEGLIGVK
ncbi:MAG: nuclease domain-containing protein [Ghiorsea sp.]